MDIIIGHKIRCGFQLVWLKAVLFIFRNPAIQLVVIKIFAIEQNSLKTLRSAAKRIKKAMGIYWENKE